MLSRLIAQFREVLGRRPTLRSHFWQTAANYLQQGFGVAFGVVLARLLEPADFGHFAYVSAVVGLFMLPGGWSLAPQVVAEAGRDPVIVSDAIRFAGKVVWGRLILLLLAVGWLAWKEGPSLAGLGLLCGLPVALGEFIGIQRASLEATGQFKTNFYDSALTVAVAMGIAIPAALLGMKAWSLALPGLPLLAAQAVLFTRLSKIRWWPSLPASGRSYFGSGFFLWLSGLGEQALQRVDKFFLGRFSTAEMLGNYNRAFNYAPLSARFLNSLVTNPTVNALARCPSSKLRHRMLLKTGGLLFIGGSLNCVALYFLADPLVPLVFGKQWISAIPVFQAFAPMSLALSLAYLPTTLLLAQKQYRTLAIVRIITVALFVGYLIWQQSHLNAVSVALALQIALALQGIVYFLCAVFKTAPTDQKTIP